jgi:hypothetical protein
LFFFRFHGHIGYEGVFSSDRLYRMAGIPQPVYGKIAVARRIIGGAKYKGMFRTVHVIKVKFKMAGHGFF